MSTSPALIAARAVFDFECKRFQFRPTHEGFKTKAQSVRVTPPSSPIRTPTLKMWPSGNRLGFFADRIQNRIGCSTSCMVQQILGNWSPESRSTILEVPIQVRRVSIRGWAAVTLPIIRALRPSGCRRMASRIGSASVDRQSRPACLRLPRTAGRAPTFRTRLGLPLGSGVSSSSMPTWDRAAISFKELDIGRRA